ncbi:hypothetical protein LP419_16435 [Massilia sp. H-1]|nr:hypothetical protein LP419_16435 [Massilia sp. H-1]
MLAEQSDYRIIIAMFLTSITVLAYLVARMTTRPLKQLAQAAKDLGNDINHPPLALATSVRNPPGQRRLQRHAGAHPAIHFPAHPDAGRDYP